MKRGRAGIITLLTAAALAAYALAGLAAAGAEKERSSLMNDALRNELAQLEEANAELTEALRRGRSQKDAAIEDLARDRLGLTYPDGTDHSNTEKHTGG